ncbi:cytochrome P450 [Mycena rosella]|uniref:Cytochrome P450 n=1 Tax=Mycena rosella TaxID=1033263 RepID=A0AAD7GED4_MYCRO|nr:cytochrome P450 [Mycena rosella]
MPRPVPVVFARKANPIPKHHLLDPMLNARDAKTGQPMTEESITQNLLTFLIAGQETSSGMMGFMVYYLLKNPGTLRKLQAEIDQVLGDAKEFRPERMMNGKLEALPPNAWQPFGFGIRGCIGRAFALQEIGLVMASIIQNFDLSFVDPSYKFEIKHMLTVKPQGLRIRAARRVGKLHLYASPSSTLMSNRDSAPAPTLDSGASETTLSTLPIREPYVKKLLGRAIGHTICPCHYLCCRPCFLSWAIPSHWG